MGVLHGKNYKKNIEKCLFTKKATGRYSILGLKLCLAALKGAFSDLFISYLSAIY